MKEKFTRKLRWILCKLLFPSIVKEYLLVERISASRLKHLQHLINLCYLHESKKDVFYKKFRESVTFEELKKHVINFIPTPEQIAEYIMYHEVLSDSTNIDYNPLEIGKEELVKYISQNLSPTEMETISLLAHGFSKKELNVIMGMKHQASINVKIHRIRKKCMGKYYK